MKRPRKGPKRVLYTLLILAGLYCVAVFSDIPFVAKWRTIWIETAMSTMNHHYLATAFIPKFVIDKVMQESSDLEEMQSGLSSNWKISAFSQKNLYLPWKKEKSKFPDIYYEIDHKASKVSKRPSGRICGRGRLSCD
jgi:hypothetical protein